ncbi:MAG: archaeal proteasome endopeptidase complex subunit alpha [Candidatus Bathyarchaeia archaeon]
MSGIFMPTSYDRTITIFSPEGRLYQVEYALELVKRGAAIVGVTCPEGAVLAANEVVESRLQDPKASWKIFQLDEHVGAAIAGLSSDARILISQARIYCQSNKLMYDESIDVEVLTRRIGDIIQMYTQHGGVRPFGVSIIFGGVDKTGRHVFVVDPSGTNRGYKATAVGKKSDEIIALLEKQYRDEMTLDESIGLAVEVITSTLEGKASPQTIKVAVIPTETKVFRRLADEEVAKYLK